MDDELGFEGPLIGGAQRALKILIAEDQDAISRVLQQTLRHLGFEVITTVGSGIDLVESASRDIPDLVIADVLMPELDGLTALDELPEQLCIVVSGLPISNAWCDANGHRLLGCLYKPFRIGDLESLMSIAVERVAE